MLEPVKILLVDDEPMVGKRLVPALTKIGARVEFFDDPVAALERIADGEFDIVITDVRMGAIDGLQVLRRASSVSPHSKVIIITGFAMMHLAREAMKDGAFDLIAKPFAPEDLRQVVIRAAEAMGLHDRLTAV